MLSLAMAAISAHHWVAARDSGAADAAIDAAESSVRAPARTLDVQMAKSAKGKSSKGIRNLQSRALDIDYPLPINAEFSAHGAHPPR